MLLRNHPQTPRRRPRPPTRGPASSPPNRARGRLPGRLRVVEHRRRATHPCRTGSRSQTGLGGLRAERRRDTRRHRLDQRGRPRPSRPTPSGRRTDRDATRGQAMTIRPILVAGDPRLTTPTTQITEVDDDLAQLVEDLFDTNAAANGAGLAANQVGDSRSVFVYDCPDDTGRHHRGHVINPVLEASGPPLTAHEGCLSVPGERFPTNRATWACVTGVDLHGAEVKVEGTR